MKTKIFSFLERVERTLVGGEVPEVELFLPVVGGTVHDRRDRCVPPSTSTSTSVPCWSSSAGEKEEQGQQVNVGGGQFSHVVDSGQTDGERQRLGVNLRVPVETERDGESEDGSQAEDYGGGQTVQQDQLQSPGAACEPGIPDNIGMLG